MTGFKIQNQDLSVFTKSKTETFLLKNPSPRLLSAKNFKIMVEIKRNKMTLNVRGSLWKPCRGLIQCNLLPPLFFQKLYTKLIKPISFSLAKIEIPLRITQGSN